MLPEHVEPVGELVDGVGGLSAKSG